MKPSKIIQQCFSCKAQWVEAPEEYCDNCKIETFCDGLTSEIYERTEILNKVASSKWKEKRSVILKAIIKTLKTITKEETNAS